MDRLKIAVAPTFLALCLLFGGSTQGVWGVALLQVLAIAIIAWAAIGSQGAPIQRAGRHLLIIFAIGTAFIAMQLVPLPPAIWTMFPGRELVVEGRATLGLPMGWAPISLAPYDTLAGMLPFLPPLAMLLAILTLRGGSGRWLALALVGTAFLGILLGLLQVSSGEPTSSPWYLYKYSSFGFANGFFANSNHMAALLLVAIPFTVALGASVHRQAKEPRKRSAIIAMTAGGFAVILLGLVLNRSLAGFGLAIPVTIASLLMVSKVRRPVKIAAIVASGLALVGFVAILFTPLNDRFAAQGAASSVSTRQAILANSLEAVGEYNVVGSGFGTFQRVYRLFEDPEKVGNLINHAHNDYLEILMEAGLGGIVLVGLFLAWWIATVRRMLATPAADEFAMAGAIGSAAILLHSAVDYPLRTAGIAAAFATCLALIVVSRRTAKSDRDLRPTRHVVID